MTKKYWVIHIEAPTLEMHTILVKEGFLPHKTIKGWFIAEEKENVLTQAFSAINKIEKHITVLLFKASDINFLHLY